MGMLVNRLFKRRNRADWDRPWLILLTLAGIIFAVETGVMAILMWLPTPEGPAEWLLDAALLTAVSFPCIYVIVVRPLQRQATTRWQDTFDAIDEMIVVIDRKHRVVLANQATREVFPGRQVLGAQCYELFHGMTQPLRNCATCEVFDTGMPARLERQEPALGDRWLSIQGYPIHAGDGGVAQVVHVVRDVTEQRQSGRQVRELKRQMEFILGATKTGIDIIDADLNIRYIDPEWAKAYGDPSGRKCYEYFMDRDGVCPGCGVPKALETKQTVVTEEALVKEGNRPIQVTTIPFQSESGEWLVAEVNVDIADRKRAEEQMAIFRQFAEASGQGFGMATLDGRITYTNPALRRMLGVAALGELTGHTFPQYYSLEAQERIEKEVLPTVMREGQWRGELALVSAGGEITPTIESFFLIRGEDGNPLYLADVMTDITERKQAEQELAQASEAASAASQAKSEFLARMSHEIRTPMNGVIGMTDLALDTDLTHEQREYLNTAKESADSLLTVINDILDFSKIEAGKLDLVPIDFDLRDCLGDSVNTLGVRADTKGLELLCSIPPDVPSALVADPGRLRQVIINLVGNSIKFTERGEVELRVGVESQIEDEVVLHFAVRDTGVGIPADKQKAIFRAFEQADGSSTRAHGGTGLGLAIAAQLVEMMGGRIWVESPVECRSPIANCRAETAGRGLGNRQSEIGNRQSPGSVFHFTARFGIQRDLPSGRLPKAMDELKGMRALVVDDNATNRRILEEMLTGWQMGPTAVNDGPQALEAMRRAKEDGEPFDLVILDVNMPEMDGFTVAERINQDPDLAGATVMMLSSAGRRGDAEHCRELGVAAYLTKPIKQSDLLDAIRAALGGHSGAAEPLVTRHSLRESRRRHRILLAEDNLVNQRLAVRLLEKQGHSVTVAANGKEALGALERDAFDVVLMDVQMPEMDGLEATRQIRDRESAGRSFRVPRSDFRIRRVPIIAMTAHAMKGDRERCLATGMDGYVSKPIRPDELLEAIESLVAEESDSEEATAGDGRGEVNFDRDRALGVVGGDAELLDELVSLFLGDYPRLVSEIEQTISNGDAQGLMRAAHTLKGTIGTFGTKGAFNAALKLETIGRDGNLQGADTVFAHLQEELLNLEQQLTPSQSTHAFSDA